MKKVLFFLFLCGLLAAATVFASEPAPVVNCSTVLQLPGFDKKVPTTFSVFARDDHWEARVTQIDQGQTITRTEEASVQLLPVRAGLTGTENPDELNLAENLVVAALLWQKRPETAALPKLGFPLDQVRAAKVYVIGKPTHMGLEAVVEALGKKDKLLGSFVAPWGVSPCAN